MKVTLIMLESLNGKIAKSNNDDLMWGGKADKKHFSSLSKEIGTIIMGSSTFEAGGKRALPKRHSIVMTRTPEQYKDLEAGNLEFTNKSPRALISELEDRGLEHVAVTGGGVINSMFLASGLLSEIYLTIAPTIFTKGTDLFAESENIEANLQLESVDKLDENTILLHYLVKN